MEIHYLFLTRYRHFENKGFNLSARFLFTIESRWENETEEKLLVIRRNGAYIENFFGFSNVKAVCGIIGKNGVGKSSILEYIASHLPEGLSANMNDDIIAYSTIAEGKEIGRIHYPEGWPYKIDDTTGFFKASPYGQTIDWLHSYRLAADPMRTDYIYYSFFVTRSTPWIDWHGLKNISTEALLLEQRNNLDPQPGSIAGYPSDLDFYSGQEMARAVQFLISEDGDKLPFSPPKHLNILVTASDRDHFRQPAHLNSDITGYLEQLESPSRQRTKTGVLDQLAIALLANFFFTERKSGLQVDYQLQDQPALTVKDAVIAFFRSLRTRQVLFDGRSVGVDRFDRMADNVPAFFQLIEEQVGSGFLQSTNPVTEPPGYRMPLESATYENFRQLMRLYLQVKSLTPFLEFRWSGLSTGQQSLLSFFSRFYHVKRHAIGSDELAKSLVILIDEGDAGYHPEWQRVFFNQSLQFLAKLFADHQLQLIYTANAPFLTSDLPKSHVLFLERMEDGAVRVHDKVNTREETFGSNIHLLFSNAFFMEGALIGQFAKEKIDAIIGYLHSDTTVTNPDYLKTIQLIGEPLIRRKLLSMWSDKFGGDAERQDLLKRLDELNRRQHD